MTQTDADKLGEERGYNEGGKLKIITVTDINNYDWEQPNLAATNSTRFSAKGEGWVESWGALSGLGYQTGFWSSTEIDENNAIERVLRYNSAKVSRLSVDKNTGLSIRCVKD